jgi:hypothetical protein
MQRMCKAFVVALGLMAIGGAGTAMADPVRNPHVEVLSLTCDNGFSGTVYAVGVSGHVAGSTTVGVLKGIQGAFIVPGFRDKELTACTAPQEPGVVFLVKL